MFGPEDALPLIYEEHFDTALYSDRISYPGAYRKLAVVVSTYKEDRFLDHAVIQGRRRDAAASSRQSRGG
jgi:hypothetical protein